MQHYCQVILAVTAILFALLFYNQSFIVANLYMLLMSITVIPFRKIGIDSQSAFLVIIISLYLIVNSLLFLPKLFRPGFKKTEDAIGAGYLHIGLDPEIMTAQYNYAGF